MSSWIPANQRDDWNLGIIAGKDCSYAMTFLRRLLDHAVEADRRIKQRDDLLKDMAAVNRQAMSVASFAMQQFAYWKDHSPKDACDEYEQHISDAYKLFDQSWDSMRKHDALQEGTT